MKLRLPILLLLSALIFIFCTGELSAATNTKPVDCVSLHYPYTRAPVNTSNYSFSNPLELYNGLIPYFRVFIPPGTMVMNLVITEGGKQRAVARHKIPPAGLPQFPPTGTPDNYFTLSELEAKDQWATETAEGFLYIFQDGFLSPSYLPVSRGGWVYVKVGGGDYSSRYINQFSVRVHTETYNEWWNKYIKDEAGWNKYVEDVETYVDPTNSTVLTVKPSNRDVSQIAGETTFDVSITGTGTTTWTAAVASADTNWLSIKQVTPSSGSTPGTITCAYKENTGTFSRKGTIQVTAAGATPVDVTVSQAPKTVPLELSVTPTNRDVAQIDIETTFSVSTGTGTIPWTATVTTGGDWLKIKSGDSGNTSATINCSFNANTNVDGSARTGTIQVKATGSTGSPKEVTVTQAGTIGRALSPVPGTGQTKCYGDTAEIPCPNPGQPFYGQDANYTINPMSYTKLDGSGNVLPDSAKSWVTVRDNVTGLIWEVKHNMDGIKNYNDPNDADNTYTWYDSNPATNGGYAGTLGNDDTEDFIKALNDAHYGGYSDWRLPTNKELAYIADFSSIEQPMINAYFPNTVPNYYWSATTSFGSTMWNAWGVDFRSNKGYPWIYSWSKDDSNYVRAVRGEQSGSQGNLAIGSVDAADSVSLDYASTTAGIYTANVDGTVTDVSTGLMWGPINSASSNWQFVLESCEASTDGGHSDWRLPTIKELQSLVDYSKKRPAINTDFFPDMLQDFYWSATTGTSTPTRALGVNFLGGDSANNSKPDNNYNFLAVRGVPFLSAVPGSKVVESAAGTDTFSVFNSTGKGTMSWTAEVVPTEGSWFSITSVPNGTVTGNTTGTINYSFNTNAGASARTGTIRVTGFDGAIGSLGSPVDLMVIQEGTTKLSVSPHNRDVATAAGTTTFSVSAGTETTTWTAAVAEADASWLSIKSGTPSSGSTPETFTCSFIANNGASARTGTIQVTAIGHLPKEVKVNQAAAASTQTACMAIFNKDLLLQIPYLSYGEPAPTLSLWADLQYEPTSVPPYKFKLINAGSVSKSDFSCTASTLSPSPEFKIHIPDVLVSDVITHYWLDLEFRQDLSINGNVYFVLKDVGVLPK